MAPFDLDYAEDLLARLGRIPPGARPAWGSITPSGLVAHFGDILRYSMGRNGAVPAGGNWFTRHVAAPLILAGLLPLPRNVQAPSLGGGHPPSDLEQVAALLEEYLGLVQAGELEPPPHPFFGDIGVDGWARLHVIHFEHHLRQFGV